MARSKKWGIQNQQQNYVMFKVFQLSQQGKGMGPLVQIQCRQPYQGPSFRNLSEHRTSIVGL